MEYQKQDIVNRYLPRTLISRWQQHPDQTPVWFEWLEGSLMHCDVTGFTAMSEALAESGNEGAELMAGILNRFFERMLGIADEWGGMQMKFGGDAMLLYFTGEYHACQAVACGLEMQAAMKEFRNIQVVGAQYSLRMRIGIHSGQFYSASVGLDKGLLHYILLGQDVNYAADVEPKAEPGQVVISFETLNLLNDSFRTTQTKHEGIRQVKRHNYRNRHTDNLHSLLHSNSLLNRYVMPPIVEGKVSGLGGEHRRVTVVFIYLEGTSRLLIKKGSTETLKQVNSYISFVFEGLTKYGGYLITSDVSEHGDKLLCAFGAPVSKGKQENDALHFACELKDKLKSSDLELQQKIGVNSGYVFTGEIGSKNRREYTTIGDTTNLAARLMSAANYGEIIVSAKTFSNCDPDFVSSKLDPIKVKGKSQPIAIHRIESIKQKEQAYLPLDNANPIFGRNTELRDLSNIATICSHGKSQGIYVFGESGIGKSRLCLEFLQELEASGWSTYPGICQSYNAHNAFSAWYYPLRKLFNITINDSDDSAWQKILYFVQTIQPDLELFSPLIAELLAVKHATNPVVNSLDAKTKREKRIYTIAELIKATALNSPVALYFDNSQWLDSSSVELFNTILELNEIPVLVVLSSPSDISLNTESKIDKEIFTVIHLKELSKIAARDLVQHHGVDESHIEKIIARAKGNPLFLEELAHSSLDDNRDLPETVYDVVMSRLDHLDSLKKSLLKNASVLGQIFDSKLLIELAEDVKELSHEKG